MSTHDITPRTGAGKRLLDDLAGDTEGTVVLDAYRSGLAHDIAAIEAEAALPADALPEWTLIENKRLVLEVARVEVRDAEIARLRAAALQVIVQSLLAPDGQAVRVSVDAWHELNRALGALNRAALAASEPDLPLGMEDL